jgi:glycerol-3-phosphate acyltransferase PlsY
MLFLLTLAATRYVSLGSIVGAASLAALAFVFGDSSFVAGAASFTAVLVVLRHRSNLQRLWGGSERRAGEPGR